MLEIPWKPTPKDLRSFGIVILIGFGVIGTVKAFWPFTWGLTPHFHAGLGMLAGAVLVGVPAVFGWSIVLPAYWAWMGLAWLGSRIMFPVIFTTFFYLVFLPIGLTMRLLGHDPLRLRYLKQSTYWVPLERPGRTADYESQY